MKLVLLTRTGFHHTYFINRLQEEFEVACVVRESYPEKYRKGNADFIFKNLFREKGISKIKDNLFLKKFHEMYSAGFKYHPLLKKYLKTPFDIVKNKTGTLYLDVKSGDINSDGFAKLLKEIKPHVIAMLGSSVVKPNIISMPSSAIINIHSGLSPYYRGTWSYGWPLVNSEPEYIGATVHHVSPDIDSGDIICQTRPVLDRNDNLNDIFLKVISEGVELAVKTVKRIMEYGQIESCRQPQNTGRLCLSKDFSADSAHRCLCNLEKGIIEKYNSIKGNIDSGVVLFGYVPPEIYR